MAAVALPRIQKSGFYHENLIYSTAQRMAAKLRLARRLAVTTGASHRLVLSRQEGNGSPDRYIIESDTNGQWESVGEAGKIADDIKVSGPKKLAFGPDGTCDGAHQLRLDLESLKYGIEVKQATGHVSVEAL